MKNKKRKHPSISWICTGVVILLALLTWVLTLMGKNHPDKVEKLYSSSLYPFLIKKFGKFIGLFPIALGEVLVFSAVVFVIGALVFGLIKPRLVFKYRSKIFHVIIRTVGLLYVCFYFIWGFNYYRQDYMTLANIEISSASIEDLQELTLEVISKANEIRSSLPEDEEGVFFLEKDFKTLAKIANEGFQNYFVGERDLSGDYGKPKPLRVSRLMSYTGITGIYFPYTAEPNVNIDVPPASLLGTMTHEMGHQRGFAKEDEANFVGFKACINNPHPEFQYSGYYLALQYLLSDLSKRDQDLYTQVSGQIGDGVRRDLNNSYDYWKMREGKAEEVATTLNDNYLRANNQGAGVQSYSGVVKLLLADYKDKQD